MPHRLLPGLFGLLFFLSGAAALLYENLWFRRAALAFGNSTRAAALVRGGFMSGLALGSQRGCRICRVCLAFGSLGSSWSECRHCWMASFVRPRFAKVAANPLLALMSSGANCTAF